MPISRPRLEARLEELKSQLEQIRQQFIATTGAVADIEYWLAEDKAPTDEELKEL